MNDSKIIIAWLSNLFYKVGNQEFDFQLQILEKEGIKTKRKKFSEILFDPENRWNKWFLTKVNQRQILPIECVLDLEEKFRLKSIVEELRNLGVKFYVFSTKSRGMHIHIFFTREISDKERLTIIEYFGTDTMKSSHKTMIALEYAVHWKSNKTMELIESGN